MRILSARQQFLADHSSTNYLFYADKALTKDARAIVSRLSSHVEVRARTAEITYNYEGADLGEERRRKFLEHYDVEVREDYDWWALSLMLDKDRLSDVDLGDYVADGEASLTFEESGPRVRLRLEGAQLAYDAAVGEFGEDLMEGMAELGLQLREELYAGERDALTVLKRYCEENRLPPLIRTSTDVGKRLREILQPL